MNVLPTKPIEKVFIHIKGDPSVGIKAADFEAEVFIDVKCYSNEIVSTVLEDIRKQFYILYTGMAGEDVVVLFDFEVFAMNELEDKMEQEKINSNKDNRWICPHCHQKSDTWFDRDNIF